MSATKFFKENLDLLSGPTAMHDPALVREHNLNAGLLALARQIAQIEQDLRRTHQDVQRVDQHVQRLR